MDKHKNAEARDAKGKSEGEVKQKGRQGAMARIGYGGDKASRYEKDRVRFACEDTRFHDR